MTTINDRLKSKCIAPELENAAKFRGMYTAVARKLGVTPQHVRLVALGLSRSKRVTEALKREELRRRKNSTECAA